MIDRINGLDQSAILAGVRLLQRFCATPTQAVLTDSGGTPSQSASTAIMGLMDMFGPGMLTEYRAAPGVGRFSTPCKCSTTRLEFAPSGSESSLASTSFKASRHAHASRYAGLKGTSRTSGILSTTCWGICPISASFDMNLESVFSAVARICSVPS